MNDITMMVRKIMERMDSMEETNRICFFDVVQDDSDDEGK